MTYSLFRSVKKYSLTLPVSTSYFRHCLWEESCFEFLKGTNSTLRGHKPTVGLF